MILHVNGKTLQGDLIPFVGLNHIVMVQEYEDSQVLHMSNGEEIIVPFGTIKPQTLIKP